MEIQPQNISRILEIVRQAQGVSFPAKGPDKVKQLHALIKEKQKDISALGGASSKGTIFPEIDSIHSPKKIIQDSPVVSKKRILGNYLDVTI